MRQALLGVLLAGSCLMLASCAKALHVAVATENAVYNSLVKVDDRGDQATGCLPVAAAGQPPVVQPAACQRFNAVMVPALDLARSFNRSVYEKDIGKATELLSKLGAVGDAVRAEIKDTAERDALLHDLIGTIQIVAALFGK